MTTPRISTVLTGCLLLALSGAANATIFGIKSCGSASPNECFRGEVLGGGSMPPANLYSFESDGSGFQDLGAITVNNNEVDADGLAMKSDFVLFAFELEESISTSGSTTTSTVTSSRLITLGTGSSNATVVGSVTLDREIRGPVFDGNDNLWAIDAMNDQLLQVSTSTGAEVGSAIDLMLSGSSFDLSTASDIAIRADGTVVLSDADTFYNLDLGTGELTSSFSNSGTGNAGLAFNPESSNQLFAYEVNGFDDIYTYDTSLVSPTGSVEISNIINSYNAGRGDLASRTIFSVPEPASAALMGLGLAGLGFARRKRT